MPPDIHIGSLLTLHEGSQGEPREFASQVAAEVQANTDRDNLRNHNLSFGAIDLS